MILLRHVTMTLLAGLTPLVAGCSESEYVPAQGRVYYRDQPLEHGVVMFQPQHGPPARGTIQPDGFFQLTTPGHGPGARIGANQVRISCRETGPSGEGEIGLGPLLIPKRYVDFASSGLSVEVKSAGNDPFEFHLTD